MTEFLASMGLVLFIVVVWLGCFALGFEDYE
jgi:hypothetical protein